MSNYSDDFVRAVHLTPAKSAQEALDQAFAEYGKEAKVIIMPLGGSTLPSVSEM